MSVQAISWVLEHSRSQGTARCVLIAIANHISSDGTGWAYVAQVCKEANCSEDSYLRAVRWAEENGELGRLKNAGTARRAAVNRKPNEFVLLALAPADCPPLVDSLGSADCEPATCPPVDLGYADCGDQTALGYAVCGMQDADPEPYLLEPSKKQEPSVTRASSDFDDFWLAYPRRTARRAAQRAWVTAVRRERPQAIIEAAARYAVDPNREDQYTCHPATWLNQDRWLDPPLPSRGRRNATDDSFAAIEAVWLNETPAIGASP